MYNFILNIIVFTSLGVIIFLMARALPRVGDATELSRGLGFFDKLIKKVPMAKIDAGLNSFLAKFLRKSKVVVMKMDNFITHRLGKLSKKNGLSAGSASVATSAKEAASAKEGLSAGASAKEGNGAKPSDNQRQVL